MGEYGGVFLRRDPEARLDDYVALMSATTVAELHRVLVLGPPAASDREVSAPLAYFRKVHGADPTGSVETAMLLVTDPRWQTTAGPLIAAIDATGLVPSDDLDVLARAFVTAGDRVYWRCPDEWFCDDGIVISVDHGAPGVDDEHDVDRPTVAARVVAPALRRWAAVRLVRRDPTSWGATLGRARELGGPGGGALMRALLDIADSLPPRAVGMVRHEALQSGRSDVRQAALQHLALTDWAAARSLGMSDANAQVRRWAASLDDPSVTRPTTMAPPTDTEVGEVERRPVGPRRPPVEGQGSLFG